MKITDEKFILEVVPSKKVVKEKLMGLWHKEDFERFDMAYKTKLLPQLRMMGSWNKISDMRDYVMSPINDQVKSHVKWIYSNGCKHVANILPAKAIMKIMVSNVKSAVGTVSVENFATMQEAERYLSTAK